MIKWINIAPSKHALILIGIICVLKQDGLM